MNKAPKVVGVVAIFLLAGLVGYAGWAGWIQPTRGEEILGAANAPVNSDLATSTDAIHKAQDVVGTHIGTTTIGVASPTKNVTNTYVSYIGNNIRTAIYQIKFTAATTTANNTSFTVQGSNDYLCHTIAGNASSTTNVVQKDITWYDAMNNLANRVHPTSFGVGSSTLVLDAVNVNADSTAEIFLTGLSYECLRFQFSASSTAIYVGLTTKN